MITKSSFIRAVVYRKDKRELYLKFANGNYIYTEVPFENYARFITCFSLGTGFHEYIIGKFPCEKIVGDVDINWKE